MENGNVKSDVEQFFISSLYIFKSRFPYLLNLNDNMDCDI